MTVVIEDSVRKKKKLGKKHVENPNWLETDILFDLLVTYDKVDD